MGKKRLDLFCCTISDTDDRLTRRRLERRQIVTDLPPPPTSPPEGGRPPPSPEAQGPRGRKPRRATTLAAEAAYALAVSGGNGEGKNCRCKKERERWLTRRGIEGGGVVVGHVTRRRERRAGRRRHRPVNVVILSRRIGADESAARILKSRRNILNVVVVADVDSSLLERFPNHLRIAAARAKDRTQASGKKATTI